MVHPNGSPYENGSPFPYCTTFPPPRGDYQCGALHVYLIFIFGCLFIGGLISLYNRWKARHPTYLPIGFYWRRSFHDQRVLISTHHYSPPSSSLIVHLPSPSPSSISTNHHSSTDDDDSIPISIAMPNVGDFQKEGWTSRSTMDSIV